MSHAVLEDGSPLAEYLDQEPASVQPADLGSSIDQPSTSDQGSLSPRRLDRTPSPRPKPLSASQHRPTPLRSLSSDQFSEQFKYLICSSALLERDYVPGYRGLDEDKGHGERPAHGSMGEDAFQAAVHLQTLSKTLLGLINPIRERRDIALAVLALLYGTMTLIGWIPVALSTVLVVVVTVFKTTPSADSRSFLSSPSALAPVSTDPRSSTSEHVKDLIDSCHLFDDTIETALSRLAKQPTNVHYLNPLRVSLNHLTTAMVDHLASATSSLLEMGDKEELTVLGAMYDIQVVGPSLRPGRRRSSSSEDEGSSESIDSDLPGQVPRPRGIHPISLSLQTPRSTRYPVPVPISPSLPEQLQSPFHDPNDPEDRFTQMPFRSPRSYKRTNKDSPFNFRRSPLSGSPSPVTSPKLPSHGNLPSPIAANAKRRSLQNMPYNPPVLEDDLSGADLTRTRSMPFSDIQTLRSRYATGNHSRSSSLVPPPPYSDTNPRLPPSPLAPTPRIKRVVSVSPLTLPSLKAACLDIHLRRRRLACCLLGLKFDHVKDDYWEEVGKILTSLAGHVDEERRKLERSLAELSPDLPEQSLEEARPPWSAQSLDRPFDFAPRTSDSAMLQERIEEIQRTLNRAWSDLLAVRQALAAEEMDPFEESWAKVRADLGAMVRDWERGREIVKRITTVVVPSVPTTPIATELPSGEETNVPDFAKAWSDDSEDAPKKSGEADRPAIGLGITEESEPLLEEPDEAEALPAPGADEVYEAEVTGAAGRERSTLSREERIKLMKEAREQGLSLKDLLQRQKGEDGQVEAKRSEQEMLKQGGMVVDELRGMMEIIRAKKGAMGQKS
jgi:acyl carrier protein phosphodiesterase